MTFEEWFVANRMEFAIGNRAKCRTVWEAAQKSYVIDCLERLEAIPKTHDGFTRGQVIRSIMGIKEYIP